MNVKKRVNEYVTLRNKIDNLKKVEKILKAELLPVFDERGADVLTGSGSAEVRRVVSATYTIKPLLFSRRVDLDALLASCSISMTKAVDFLPRSILQQISIEGERVSLRVHV